MSEEIFLQARWVLPIDQPAIDGGVVGVAGGVITAVTKASEHSGPTKDLGDVVLIPGLVNAHTHLEFSYLEKPLGVPGMALPDWIRLVIAERNRADYDPAKAIQAGIEESLHAGVSAVGDIATVASSDCPYDEKLDLVAFQEVIGFSKARMDSVLADVEQRLSSSDTVKLGISPHAPYTVHPELVAALVDLAVQRELPVAMHLAESPEELELLENNTGAFRELLEERSMWDAEALASVNKPMDYLKILASASKALIIHGNYLDQEEIDFLGRRRDHMSVVYCPRTHEYFKHVPYPLVSMLEAGVHVALGTDSRGSTPDLSLLKEMQLVHKLHPEIPAEQILKLGTRRGAEALGVYDGLGSITPGKQAQLACVACSTTTENPYLDVLEGSGILHLLDSFDVIR